MAAQPASDSTRSLEQARQRILQQIAALGDLRPGPLHQRFIRCGKPGCRCRDKAHPGHGPYYLLQVRREGKQRTTRTVPQRLVAATQAQVAECRRLRRLVAELIEISERLCDARDGKAPDCGKKRELLT